MPAKGSHPNKEAIQIRKPSSDRQGESGGDQLQSCGHQRRSSALSGPSEALVGWQLANRRHHLHGVSSIGNQTPSEAIRRHHLHGVSSIGNQTPSEAIRRHHLHGVSSIRNQTPSEAIRRHHLHGVSSPRRVEKVTPVIPAGGSSESLPFRATRRSAAATPAAPPRRRSCSR